VRLEPGANRIEADAHGAVDRVEWSYETPSP
jgi:hypothetical protein